MPTYDSVVGVCGRVPGGRGARPPVDWAQVPWVRGVGRSDCEGETTSKRPVHVTKKNRHVTVLVVGVQNPERSDLEHMPDRSHCIGVHTPRPPELLAKELCLKAHAKYCPTPEFVLVDGVRTRCVSDATIEQYINVGQLASWPFSLLSHYATSEPFKVDGVEGMNAMKWSSTNSGQLNQKGDRQVGVSVRTEYRFGKARYGRLHVKDGRQEGAGRSCAADGAET